LIFPQSSFTSVDPSEIVSGMFSNPFQFRFVKLDPTRIKTYQYAPIQISIGKNRLVWSLAGSDYPQA